MFAEIKRDNAIERVERATPKEWKDSALAVLKELAMTTEELTTDDLWSRLDHPPEPRAMGAIMRRAQKAGWITPTNRIETSARPECHARPIRVWRSCYANQ